MDYIIINSDIVKKHETGFLPFFWNEPIVVTQKIWFGFGGIPLFHENIESIKSVLGKLNCEIPEIFNDERELFRITKRMLNKNRYYRSGIIACNVFIGRNETNTILTSRAFPEFDFTISKQGLLINFSEIAKNSGNPLNQFGFFNKCAWEFTNAENRKTIHDNSVFLNEKGCVCDCISANLFMVKGKTLLTPSVKTGCYTDELRDIILEVSAKANLAVSESEGIKKEDIFQMNEIFLASEENGIQWVLGVDGKRYVHHHSLKINELVNDYLKRRVK